METATVLHLSDLHFGADEDETVWNAFIDHVRTMQPRPTAALITGDVVDSPHDRFFRRANKNLMALSQVLGGTAENYAENVFVCPGNHDRYWMGNRLLPSLLPKFGNYDKFLNKREVNQPFITYVGSATNRWKLWISQVDTSQHAGIFAQGFVNQRELKLIRGLKKEGYDPETPFSLVILMMHHHALPIASLEPEDPKKHFFAFTNPTNPGRILEGLIDGHVDLVLHGHEHRSHAARYALYNSDKGELAVVGAGSATGMYTDEFRCVVSKSSFNLIEFRSDRSVWLRVMNGAGSYEAPSWAEARDLSVQLLGGTAIRRNRFLRIRTQETATAQTQPADHPKQYGEWQRHITLTPYRDALVWDKRSHWPLKGGKLGFQLINETGLPVLPKASIYLKNRPGRAEKVKDVQIGRIEGETRIFGFVACVSPKLAEDVESIETSFKWDDAIMLTQSDMALLDRNNVSGLRSRGLEFVAATVPKDIPLATLTLTVTFPVGYRPKRPRVSVQVLNTNKADDGFIEDKALGARLQMAGQTLVLAIPYPLTGYRYAIAWPPVAEPTQKAEGKKRLIDRLVANEKFGADLAAIAADTFVREGWSQVTAAVYVPDPTAANGKIILKRIGGIAEHGLSEGISAAADGHPRVVSLAITASPRMQALYRTAWWGERGCYGRDGPADGDANEAGVLPSEAAALVLPIWPGERLGHPAAIFRIGLWRAGETEQQFVRRLTPESWQQALEKVEFRVLHELVR